MLSPFLIAGVVKWNCFAANRIQPSSFGVFVVITTLARQGQIIQRSLSTLTFGNDMFNGKRLIREPQLIATVFTAFPCSTDNDLFLLSRNTFLRQRPVPVSPTLSSMLSVTFGAGEPVRSSIQDVAHSALQIGL